MARGRSGRVANALTLVAAPTFLLMALVTFLNGDAQTGPHCRHLGSDLPLFGMTPMYLLMAIFHLKHWLWAA